MRTIATVLVTAIVTAGLTSAIWIFTFAREGEPAPTAEVEATILLQPEITAGGAAATSTFDPQEEALQLPVTEGKDESPQAPSTEQNEEFPQPPATEATEVSPQAPSTEPKEELPQLSSTTHIGDVPDDLIAKRLTIPVPGIKPEALKPAFFDARGQLGHEAIDIVAPKGQPVVATENGTIAKLFTSERGGLTVYQFDPAEKYAYYYAHLDRYADTLAEGDSVKRGQIIGYVGSTGNADPAGPHLHFAIFLLGPERLWWKGEALDPYPALTQR